MAEVIERASKLNAFTATQFYNDVAQELDSQVLVQVIGHLAGASPGAVPQSIRISVLKQVICLLDGHSGLIERLGGFINGTIEVMDRRAGEKVAFLYGSNNVVRELWRSGCEKKQDDSRKRCLIKQESTDDEDNSKIVHDDSEHEDNISEIDAANAAAVDEEDSQEWCLHHDSEDDEEEEALDPPDGEMQLIGFTAITSRLDADGDNAEQAGIFLISRNMTVCQTSFTNVLSLDERNNARPKGTILVALSSLASNIFRNLDEQVDYEAYVIGVAISGHTYDGQQRDDTQPQCTFCNKTTVMFCRMGRLSDLSTDQRQKLRQDSQEEGVDAHKIAVNFKELWEEGAIDLSNDYRGELLG